MKTKLEMAHDYAMKHIQEGWDINYDVLVVDAWQYADAMQAEADKREKEEIEKRSVELRNILDLSNFKPLECQEEWQPNWSQAPSGYDWFVVGGCSGKGFFCLVEPAIVKDHYWFVGEDCLSVDKHNYQGDWRESLRKRPK